MFFKKKQKYYIVKDELNKYCIKTEKYLDNLNYLFVTTDFEQAYQTSIILNQFTSEMNILITYIKEMHNKIDNIDRIVDPKLSTGQNVTIGPIVSPSYSCFVENIKNKLEDPDTFYAVQGHFPNITVSKYTKECEDSFNYCLKQETGNLSLLPKSICFNKKSDAIEYQNELIQKAIQEQSKSKKK